MPPAVQPSPNDHIHLDPHIRQMSGFVSSSLDQAEPVARDENDPQEPKKKQRAENNA